MTAADFSLLFVIALSLSLGLRTWLALRQLRHVRANRDRVPAAFADSIPLEAHRKAAAYTASRTLAGLIDLAVGSLWVLWLTLGGGLQSLYALCARLSETGSISHGLLLISAVAVLGFLIDLPLTLYRTFRLEARFGFNRMTPTLFISDLLKQSALSAALGLPLAAIVLWLMAQAGATWWLWTWLAWLGFSLAMMLIVPLFVAPLFNRFQPLQDEALRTRVESLLRRCGFRAKGLFVMDGSRRSAHGNAYFTGFGAARRIVLFDTLIERLNPGEIEAVLAHEIGHFRLGHLWRRLAVSALGSLALLALLGWLAGQDWFYAGLGVEARSNAVTLILFVSVLPSFLFLLTPLGSLWSRKHEFEADAYAAQHAQAGELVSALVKLYRDNAATLTPDPLHSAVYDSHPPAAQRVARLLQARA